MVILELESTLVQKQYIHIFKGGILLLRKRWKTYFTFFSLLLQTYYYYSPMCSNANKNSGFLSTLLVLLWFAGILKVGGGQFLGKLEASDTQGVRAVHSGC